MRVYRTRPAARSRAPSSRRSTSRIYAPSRKNRGGTVPAAAPRPPSPEDWGRAAQAAYHGRSVPRRPDRKRVAVCHHSGPGPGALEGRGTRLPRLRVWRASVHEARGGRVPIGPERRAGTGAGRKNSGPPSEPRGRSTTVVIGRSEGACTVARRRRPAPPRTAWVGTARPVRTGAGGLRGGAFGVGGTPPLVRTGSNVHISRAPPETESRTTAVSPAVGRPW